MNIDSMIQGNPQALVTSYNGVLVADSLEVADRFGKRHTHVLRSIDDLINQLESQSTQNWADYFIPDDYQDNKNRTQRRFKLTRDGFSLLVMGFTGPAALHWKLLYIEAFNKMEQALRSNVDMAIVSYVNSLGSSPIEFIRKLPDYVGNPHPDADEVLQALENIREDHGVQRYGICFPEGYANRKERRCQEKEARKQARKELLQYGR